MRLERSLFFLVILIEAGLFLYLILGRYIPGGSDGFKYFYLQYYFLNNAVNYGEIPQWCPFLTHGAVTTWWYIYQGGILQDMLLLCGSALKGINFLPIFYTGMFIDHLLLLAGVWLLGKRFFESPFTLFFVALSIMGSCIWFLQVWWNFHFYYAIPMVLYLIHLFFDTGKWRYVFLAGNLLMIQAIGGLPYFLPVTSLVIFLYFLFYCIFHFRETLLKVRTFHYGWPFVLTVLTLLLSFVALYIAMNFGTDQIQVANLMRNVDGSVDLDTFLTYGGKISWRTWLELLLGVSPAVDYNLYIGIFCVPLILAGISLNTGKDNAHFLLTGIILLLFSMGTFVSIIAYYGWPMMKYFRHLVLITPIIKIFLCFLAGFGFESLFLYKTMNRSFVAVKVFSAIIAFLMLGISTVLWFLAKHYDLCAGFYESMVPRYIPLFLTLFNDDVISPLIIRTAVFSLAGAALFAGILLNNYRHKTPLVLIALILVLHGADIYSYKFSQIKLRTAALSDEHYQITAFQKIPYARRRDVSFENNNPRAGLLNDLPMDYGVFYWTTHAFLFKDQLGNPFKTDSWLLPLDQYMRAYWGQSIHDFSVKLQGLVYPSMFVRPRLVFPKAHPAALKISGVTEDKIQFFRKAEVVGSDDLVTSYITRPDYTGDMIFLSPPGDGLKHDSHFSAGGVGADQRIYLPYRVTRFDSNNLTVTIQNDDYSPAWLLYSDVWHPYWKATLNGQEVPVYKANLAYKAVKLEKGFNKVHFYYKSSLLSALYTFFGLNSLFWLVAILFATGKIFLSHGEGFKKS